jgi:hypothetical protein
MCIASNTREIEVVTRKQHMQEREQYFVKTYSQDYLPQQPNRFHQFGRYNFEITEEQGPVRVNIKLDTPADRFLLDYMRIKVVTKDKAGELMTNDIETFNQKETGVTTFETGSYTVLVEGAMPYATTEGQI